MLGRFRVGAGEADAPVRDPRHRRPHLLTVEPPSAVHLDGLGGQAREIGPGAGFGEELTPHEIPAQRLRDESLDLLGTAVRDQGRHHPVADDHVVRFEFGGAQFLGDDELRDGVGGLAPWFGR